MKNLWITPILRELLELATKDDLLGLARDPYEQIVDMGVRDSGYGRELSRLGLHAFVNHKTVWVD